MVPFYLKLVLTEDAMHVLLVANHALVLTLAWKSPLNLKQVINIIWLMAQPRNAQIYSKDVKTAAMMLHHVKIAILA